MEDSDELRTAIARLRLSEPDLTAKQVHQRLAAETQWAELPLSAVKKASSKMAKAGCVGAVAAKAVAAAADETVAQVVNEMKMASGANEITNSTCAQCDQRHDLFRCAGCKLVSYCSPSCQQKHWKQHKSICRSIGPQTGHLSRPWKQGPGEPRRGPLMACGAGVGSDGSPISGASQCAADILQRDPELRGLLSATGVSQFYFQPLQSQNLLVSTLPETFLPKRGKAAGRVQYAQQLGTGLGMLTNLLASQRQASDARRSSLRKGRRPEPGNFLRRGVVVIECNGACVEDLMGPKDLPNGSVMIFYCPRNMLQQYVASRMQERFDEKPSKERRNDPASTAKVIDESVDNLPASALPIVVAYQHKEDSTGFAFTSLGAPFHDHGDMLSQACLRDDGGCMGDVNAIVVRLPALEVNCYDADQSSFRTVVSQEDKKPSSSQKLPAAIPVANPHQQRFQSERGRHAYSASANAVINGLVDGGTVTATHEDWLNSLEAQGIPKTPDAPGGIRSGEPVDTKSIERFMLRFAPMIHGFAATRFAELGKGACFIFCRLSLSDLTDLDPKDPSNHLGPRNAAALDRQFVLCWGTEKETHKKDTFTAAELYSKFPERVQTLPRSISVCSKTQYPLVICGDPHGKKLPKFLRGAMRPMKCPPGDLRNHSEDIETVCMISPFFDFETMLAGGKDFGYDLQHVAGLNMDRHVDDPNTD